MFPLKNDHITGITYCQAPRLCILKLDQSFCQSRFADMYNSYLYKKEKHELEQIINKPYYVTI